MRRMSIEEHRESFCGQEGIYPQNESKRAVI